MFDAYNFADDGGSLIDSTLSYIPSFPTWQGPEPVATLRPPMGFNPANLRPLDVNGSTPTTTTTAALPSLPASMLNEVIVGLIVALLVVGT